jgi:hypothetical protein
MNTINFSNLKGFPLTQDDLDFLQQSYLAAFNGIAKLCGDKTILAGVEHVGGAVSAGWIVYNGEMLPFVASAYAANVVIIETDTALTFGDNTLHDVIISRYATCGVSGLFPFSDLVPLTSLQNIWLPGDLKMKYVDATYEDANFDSDGYGVNREKGWRKLSSAVPSSAGKALVNKAADDTDFGTVGNVAAGEKKHKQSIAEMPVHKFKNGLANDSDSLFVYGGTAAGGGSAATGNAGDSAGAGNRQGFTETLGSGTAFNIIQPSFVVLTLIKL